MSRPKEANAVDDLADLDDYSNTTTFTKKDEDGDIVERMVKLHDTNVARINWNRGLLILNHGGYKTRTTLRRMNQFLSVMHVSYYVRKDKGEFYLWKEFVLDEEREDEIVLSFNGNERVAHSL